MGYSRAEVKPHISFWKSIVHPEDMPKTEKILADHLEGKIEYYETENRLRMRTGEYVWNLNKGRVISRDSNGKPLRMVGADTDISREKEARENIKEKVDELEKTNKMMVGRELKMIDLKKRISKLEKRSNAYDPISAE